MQDPEFEKQVREKMNGLKFSPSDSVWEAVQQRISRDRKRRPLFWLFLFGAGLLAGAGSLLLLNNGEHPYKHNPGSGVRSNAESRKPEEQSGLLNDDRSHNTDRWKTELAKGIQTSSSNVRTDVAVSKSGNAAKKQKNLPGNAEVQQGTTAHFTTKNTTGENKISPTENIKVQTPIANDVAVAAAANNAGASTSNPPPDKIEPKKNADSIAALSKEQLKSADSLRKKTDDGDEFLIGVTAGGGISDVFTSTVSQQSVYAAYVNMLSANPGYSAAAPTGSQHPAAIKPGFSFFGGFVGERKLAKKWALSFGLNYRYYSAGVENGGRQDTGTYASTQGSVYYRVGSGHLYTNQYHFIEIPISVSYQVNQGKKLPMFVEAGFAASQMVTGKALSYDYLSGMYAENSQHFSRTQFLGQAAYMFSLKQKGAVLKLGPQVQYAFTNLSDNSSLAKQHLFFAGLRVAVLSKK